MLACEVVNFLMSEVKRIEVGVQHASALDLPSCGFQRDTIAARSSAVDYVLGQEQHVMKVARSTLLRTASPRTWVPR